MTRGRCMHGYFITSPLMLCTRKLKILLVGSKRTLVRDGLLCMSPSFTTHLRALLENMLFSLYLRSASGLDNT